uniref:Uncharacterized protein n=1 Tax=Oryza meridionalis TaxID=40149 RepID=A0A0E0BX06_9ORYZ
MPVRVVDTATPSSQAAHLSVMLGTQNVSTILKEEAWKVNVRIHGCDVEQWKHVVTFWEGEIVDAKKYTFFTGKWEASQEDDIRHWSKFPSFTPLLGQIETDGGKSVDLSNYAYIFMVLHHMTFHRWKEQYFVNVGVNCGLTIAGFYYVCFSCSDGSISGYYYDPNSCPFQKLELKCTNEKDSGFTFSSYELQ